MLLRNVRPRGYDAPVDIAIADGRITAIGPDLAADGTPGRAPVGGTSGPAEDDLDAGGRAVLPGLVEPHLHLDKALLDAQRPGNRGQHADRGTLDGAVAVTAELKAGFTPDDVRRRATTVLEWALRHGTTSVRTPVDVDPTVGLTGLDVLLELREAWAGRIDVQVVPFPQEGIAARPGTHELLEEALRRGADVIGACGYAEADAEGGREHLRQVFALAERFGVPVDVHADFADDASDPRHDLAGDIADLTDATGMGGRVVLGHVTTLAGLAPDRRGRVLERLAAAEVGVVVLPPTDLHLRGRSDDRNVRRGIAPVRALVDARVATAFSSNNIRNAFTPFGNADVLETALLLAQTGHLGTGADLDLLLDMGTSVAARLIGRDGHDLHPGSRADLVVLDAPEVHAGLLGRAPRRWVLAGGEVVAETETVTTVH